MSNKQIKTDFSAMNVAELKEYLQERGVSVSGYLKTSLVEIASACSRKNGFAGESKLWKGSHH